MGAEGPEAPIPPEFGRSVNPIETMGGRVCPSQYYQSPPRFKMLSTPLFGPDFHFGGIKVNAKIKDSIMKYFENLLMNYESLQTFAI